MRAPAALTDKMTAGAEHPNCEIMFTGIITDVGRIVAVEPGRDARAFVVESRYDPATIALGASIAHAGACLTVIAVEPRPDGAGARHRVEVSAETLSKTTLGDWVEGGSVNLERAARLGDELGGHLVTGHVDLVGRVRARREVDGSIRFTIAHDLEFAPFVAAKGSVCVDGVSLTVNAARPVPPRSRSAGAEARDVPDDAASFDINIIPHTAEATTLGGLREGDPVNLEADLIARYVARQRDAVAWRDAVVRRSEEIA